VSSTLRLHLLAWPAEDLSARLATHDAVVVSASLLASDAELDRVLGVLEGEERVRFATYTNAVVARRFAIARGTVREVLGSVLGLDPSAVPLHHGLHGKPALARGAGLRPLWFSVAHCEDLVLVAVSRTMDVGVDLERARSIEQWERVADRVLDPAERAQLRDAVEAGHDAGTAFLRHWCRVEAELKAIGCGIAGLEAHRAGKRPLGLRLADLPELPLPADVAATGARYQAAVALCAPGVDSARQSVVAPSHAITPTISPATASTP
jgi:phosphopantetheinyl transferase